MEIQTNKAIKGDKNNRLSLGVIRRLKRPKFSAGNFRKRGFKILGLDLKKMRFDDG